MLHINELTFRIGGRMLFDQATVVVPAGHKVGFVGRNGTGKSTLIKLILDELHPDEGSLTLRPRIKVACVAQEAPDGSISLINAVLETDLERTALLDESETATDATRISEIHERLNDIDAYTAPTRAAAILSGLGFSEAAQQESLNSFSGGWRMRVALASTLFANPDMLLLDEPTNHLDLEASMWLENHLKNWRGTLFMISHDRTFLNAVANEIIHLENMKLVRYAGNYDRFERTRRERLELDSKMRTRQTAQRKHLQAFVDRFRYSATKAKQAQSRIKMIERLQPIAEAMADQSINFDFPQPKLLSPPIIALEDAQAGYEVGKPILRDLNLRVDMDDRIGLLGANGNGKSTLIKLLGARLKPMEGSLRKSSKLKTGFFAQHQVDELSLNETAFEHMLKLMPLEPETRIRAHLGRFGFQGKKADTKASSLSGGEKARLVLSIMSRESPHLLLLDEPTNHLDVDSREALVHSINAYEGAVVLVSHDVHLLETTCDRLWLVDNGTVEVYDGDLEEYKKLLLERKRAERQGPEKKMVSSEGGPVNKKEQRRLKAAMRAEASNMQRAVKDAEKKMEKLSADMKKVEASLADPKLYDGGREKDVIDLQSQLKTLKQKLLEAEEMWIAATASMENA
jgi:ATP-binding cassette, subfamily F, member 3